MDNRLLYAWRQSHLKKQSEHMKDLQTLIEDVMVAKGECVLEGVQSEESDATTLREWAAVRGWDFDHDGETVRFSLPK